MTVVLADCLETPGKPRMARSDRLRLSALLITQHKTFEIDRIGHCDKFLGERIGQFTAM